MRRHEQTPGSASVLDRFVAYANELKAQPAGGARDLG
jgi:hypothetical protein